MLQTLQLWLKWGVENETDPTMQRKILHCNVAALIAIASLAAFSIFFLLIWNDALLKIVLLFIPFYFVLSVIPWFNRNGWTNTARWVLVSAVVGSQALAILVALGSLLDLHYYFILFAILPITLFPTRHRYSIIFLFVLNVSLFLTFEFHPVEPDPKLFEIPTTIIRLLSSANAIGSFITMLTFVWMVEIVAERNERQLAKMAVTDLLTELPNRRFFEMVFQQEVAKSRRDKESLSLALLDIDHFKRINDTYGHDVGDEVLKQVALLLRKAIRAGNVVARVGGEEFTLLLPNTSLKDAADIAERIRHSIESGGYVHQGQVMKVTISIGVVAVDCDASAEYSYKQADEMLYLAKNAGRNRVATQRI